MTLEEGKIYGMVDRKSGEIRPVKYIKDFGINAFDFGGRIDFFQDGSINEVLPGCEEILEEEIRSKQNRASKARSFGSSTKLS